MEASFVRVLKGKKEILSNEDRKGVGGGEEKVRAERSCWVFFRLKDAAWNCQPIS